MRRAYPRIRLPGRADKLGASAKRADGFGGCAAPLARPSVTLKAILTASLSTLIVGEWSTTIRLPNRSDNCHGLGHE